MDEKEKKVLEALIEYIEFVSKYFYEYPTKNEYQNFCKWIIKKHIEKLESALENICLGNLCATASQIRIIIENYVLFYYTKKYKKQEIWKDYKNWSYVHMMSNIIEPQRRQQLKKIIEKYAEEENFKIEDYEKKGSYSWLSKVLKEKDYTFKKIATLIKNDMGDIYKDFNDLSRFIHENDYVTKIDFYDPFKMAYLTSFLLKYTNGILELLDKRTLQGTYKRYYYKLGETLEECNNKYKIYFN